MPDYRPDQIEHARRTLARPDLTISPAHRALNERIARHILKSAEAPRRNVIPFPQPARPCWPPLDPFTAPGGSAA
ncbi:hypothetical protein [Pseudogemmobacter humi]|uniref:hypothetical protein n=1 Tax=Pseudogemmobacter humi TaxID=2483812 RepID=UPI000F53EF98|nr:hypothetical protein [Pseudogemmobacter humi]